MDRPVKAMGILDGIVEWIAEQIMYGLDMINTSVLGALGCDMNTFLRYFPAAETMYILTQPDAHSYDSRRAGSSGHLCSSKDSI